MLSIQLQKEMSGDVSCEQKHVAVRHYSAVLDGILSYVYETEKRLNVSE